MKTIYIGAEDKLEVISILNDMSEQGYIDWYDEDSIKEEYGDFVDFDNAYIRNYGNIQAVYSTAGFFGRDVYAVDVEE